MFILLINCPFDDAKVRRVWEMGKYLGGLSSEVVATGAAICDKAAAWGLNRVATYKF